ncbi:MAG TPA: 2-C-methyl-D-erythritol 2,4-cyclodiphosphate synthase [Bacteroidales bacterium]|nr:2-C-methyl-D-erythritol 2,4-cyclodiphosphate synthase [Bacteroidales bacterium]HPR72627.1 2-C-methyl-D-erythritol 2,4-cyclodiphosphate synthase [Bacteroidales bacterium]
MNLAIGQGIDFHRLEPKLNLWIGGVLIPSEKGCVAHSDGDVLLHAICDALLGAAGMRDIGYFFPDTSEEFKNIDSKILLQRTYQKISKEGFRIGNLDCTVLLEKPKISSYIPEMKTVISGILETEAGKISIKATTTEKMGFIGKEEGIAAMASVLLEK